MNKGVIVPLFYLPPVSYFSKLIEHKNDIMIEACEHFPKQTYRNRASIQSHNGKLDLIIPVIKGSNAHTKIKEVKISYDFNWQRQHWMSLQTCYRTSSFFEFYETDFAPFYEKKWEYLFDYNLDLFQLLCSLLKLTINPDFTIGYERIYEDRLDLRESLHPKITEQQKHKPYFQVFEDRNGFLPGLSIADLLFSQGPNSSDYL